MKEKTPIIDLEQIQKENKKLRDMSSQLEQMNTLADDRLYRYYHLQALASQNLSLKELIETIKNGVNAIGSTLSDSEDDEDSKKEDKKDDTKKGKKSEEDEDDVDVEEEDDEDDDDD